MSQIRKYGLRFSKKQADQYSWNTLQSQEETEARISGSTISTVKMQWNSQTSRMSYPLLEIISYMVTVKGNTFLFMLTLIRTLVSWYLLHSPPPQDRGENNSSPPPQNRLRRSADSKTESGLGAPCLLLWWLLPLSISWKPFHWNLLIDEQGLH